MVQSYHITTKGAQKLAQQSYHEQKQHGVAGFPFNLYPCTIPGDFLQVPLHWQAEMELIYVKKGTGLVQVGMERYTARAGDIFIITPGTLHALAQAGADTMEYENIIFRISFLAAPDDLCTERYLLPLQSGKFCLPAFFNDAQPIYPQLCACLQALEDAGRHKTAGYELTVKAALLRLLAVLVDGGGAVLPAAETTDSRRLKLLMQFITESWPAPISISDAAAACGCSESHFMRWFRRMTGQSFTAYLLDRRLHTAAEALRRGEDKIVTIAGAAGFDNLSYFNRCFKRRFGQTPRDYRAAAQRTA